jgi:hypothetical protein
MQRFNAFTHVARSVESSSKAQTLTCGATVSYNDPFFEYVGRSRKYNLE